MSEFRVVFVAHDYQAMVDFLVDVIGLEVVEVFEEWDVGIVLRAGDGLIEIFPPGDEPEVPAQRVWLAWQVSDADAEYERLRRAGADMANPPAVQSWGHKSFRVAGPQNLRLTLYELVDSTS